MNPNYRVLFDSFTFKNGNKLKNRIVMAPMTNYSSNADGTVSDAELEYYKRRSKGIGMVITACTNVTPNGKGFKGEFEGHSDDMIPSLRKLANTIKKQGAKAVIQIFHGGRSCPPDIVPNGEIFSASRVAQEGSDNIPKALTEDEIKDIILAFGETTRRAIKAGFDGVEIHGANGYLIHQFFSPHSNRRDDDYGGSLEKRLKFPLAIVDEVKRVVKSHGNESFIVGYRFSPEEASTPGITMKDTIKLVDKLADKSLDYLHVSLMDFWSKPRRGVEDTKTRIKYLLETIDERVPLIGVGSIHTPEEAKKALNEGVHMVALGRELLMEPDWVEKLEKGKESDIVTTLSKKDQDKLVIPDPLWKKLINTKGWLPVVD